MTFCVDLHCSITAIHRLPAKAVREPLFPWEPWGAREEKDGMKAKRTRGNDIKGEKEKRGNGLARIVTHMKKGP